MSIIQSINNFFAKSRAKRNNKRLTKLEEDIMKLSNRLKYDPKFNSVLTEFNTEEEFNRRIAENIIWFSGKPLALRRFYLTSRVSEELGELNFFWQKAKDNYRKIHSGIPNLICTKMPIILFGGGYDIKADVFKRTDSGRVTNELDTAACKRVEDTLKALIDVTNLDQLFENQAVNESRDGHTFLKFNYDINISKFPILEVVDIRNAEIVKERGITKSIIFKSFFNKGSKDYVLHEIYGTNEDGYAQISYKLYEIKLDGNLIEVSLGSIEETSELCETIIFKGVNGMIAFEKPNKLPNSEFLDVPYGASDYSGAITAFDGLDETLSEIFAEIRNNKTIRYIPKSMLERVQATDSEGNPYIFTKDLDSFITNYQKVEDTIGENSKNEISITQIPDKMQSLLDKWKVGITTACNKAGISPLALGITGLESINSGADSQRERNKATLETRASKLRLWKRYMSNVYIKLLEFNDWMRTSLSIDQPGIDTTNVDWNNCNINVNFGDYITESETESINTWGGAKTQGIASLETCVDKIHKDWSDEQKLREINRIKFEQGMSLDNPMNLPDLDILIDNKENENNNSQNKLVDKQGKEIKDKE